MASSSVAIEQFTPVQRSSNNTLLRVSSSSPSVAIEQATPMQKNIMHTSQCGYVASPGIDSDGFQRVYTKSQMCNFRKKQKRAEIEGLMAFVAGPMVVVDE